MLSFIGFALVIMTPHNRPVTGTVCKAERTMKGSRSYIAMRELVIACSEQNGVAAAA